jgi:hypothetical protein
MRAATTIASIALWSSIALACVLTFVWPFAVSEDPSDPRFRVLAISALLVFLASLVAALALRTCRAPRT